MEYDAEGRLLCPAALWGKDCRYFKGGACKFSHAVPPELGAKYAAHRAEQRAWEGARRAEARAEAKRVVPPTPQPDSVEAARKELFLACEGAAKETHLVDLVRALLECQEGEALQHLHWRGPGLTPKKSVKKLHPTHTHVNATATNTATSTATNTATNAERSRRAVLGWLERRLAPNALPAPTAQNPGTQHTPPPVPLCPTLIHAFKLGGFKLPTLWSKEVRNTKHLIKKMRAHAAYKAFLASKIQIEIQIKIQIMKSLSFVKTAPKSGFEMCFAAGTFGAGVWCWGAKHVSNPV